MNTVYLKNLASLTKFHLKIVFSLSNEIRHQFYISFVFTIDFFNFTK